MTHAQYICIEQIAGGAGCSDIEFIRACHSILDKSIKLRSARQIRHNLLRAGLAIKAKASYELR